MGNSAFSIHELLANVMGEKKLLLSHLDLFSYYNLIKFMCSGFYRSNNL